MCEFWGWICFFTTVAALVKGIVTWDGNTVVGGVFVSAFMYFTWCVCTAPRSGTNAINAACQGWAYGASRY